MAPMKLYMTRIVFDRDPYHPRGAGRDVRGLIRQTCRRDHFKPDYVAINPKSTIPTLVRSDGTALTGGAGDRLLAGADPPTR